jgi:ATP-dependent RNA helicase DDX21
MAQVSGADVATDAGNFKNYPEITEKTQEVLTAKGITGLFPIQQQCFYHMYNREDLIARDLTGSGKTLAFALPIVEYLRKNNLFKTGHVQAIMIAPTRELALQITAEITKLKHSVEEFKVVTVYGGVSVRDQANQLKAGVDIFVGTTGRVIDHIQRGNIDFKALKTLVLDEADVMLNMGFKQDIEKVLEKVNEVREGEIQIGLFSATVPTWVRDIALEFMKPDFRVVDLAQDLSNKTAKNVKHVAMECD